MKRPKLVFDATPLIYLAKASLLETTLQTCIAYTTKTVIHETTDTTYPDAVTIRDCIDKGLIKIYSPSDDNVKALKRHPDIHLGEAEVLASAKELNAYAVIDDKEARAVATIYDIKTRLGTLYLLFKLVSSGNLDARTAEERLDAMVEAGLYLDPRTLIAARNRLNECRTRNK